MVASAQGRRAVADLQSDRLLLVEGGDEERLLLKLLNDMQMNDFQVINVEGQTNFESRLSVALSQANIQGITLSSLGLVRDADDDPRSAFTKACDALRANRLPVPAGSELIVAGVPKVGVFISPSGTRTGSIEDICWDALVETDHSAVRCINSFVDCLRGSAALDSTNEGKTRIHAYLSSRKDPVSGVGVGAQRGYWPLYSPAFNGLRQFIRDLH